MEKAENLLAWTGDPVKVRALIAESPDPKDATLALVAFQLDLYQRDYRSALSRFTPETMNDLAPQVRGRIAVLSVLARESLGDYTGALSATEENRRMLDERVTNLPKDFLCRAYLAVTLAQLGRASEALAQAKEAVRQSNADRFSGPRAIEAFALVNEVMGHNDEAFAALVTLSRTPYQDAISSVDLERSPAWARLREQTNLLARVRRRQG